MFPLFVYEQCLKLWSQTMPTIILFLTESFFCMFMLNNRDLRVTECHVASVYPCWDVGEGEVLAPYSHPKVTLPPSLSVSLLSPCADSSAQWLSGYPWCSFCEITLGYSNLQVSHFPFMLSRICVPTGNCLFVCSDSPVSGRDKGCEIVPPLNMDLMKSFVCLLTASKGQILRY